MSVDAVLLTAGAALVYGWLCATVAPLACAVHLLISTRGERRAWIVLALAAGSGVLWSAVAAAALLLGVVLVPSAALAVLLSPVTIPGVSLGVMLWGVQTVSTALVPRVSPAFELDTALALLWFAGDGSRLLKKTERLYGAVLIDEPADVALTHRAPYTA
jgi:hypothetical protein